MKKHPLLASTLIAASFTLSVPALAAETTYLPNSTSGTSFNLGSNSEIATGDYAIAEGEKQGWFIPWNTSGGAGNTSLSFGENTTFSGTGLIGIFFNRGDGNTVETVDLQNVDATNFSGQLIVVNNWNNETDVKLLGDTWANVEYVFANAVDDPTLAEKYGLTGITRGDLNSDLGTKTLDDYLALQGNTTLAGVTGATKGTKGTGTASNIVLCDHEFITVISEDTTLTIAGSDTYGFYGTVGANSSGDVTRASLEMTGDGSQTFGGTNYLYAVTASAGTLILSGTNDISSTVSVADGGTLNISGTTTFGSTVTVAEGGTLELGGEITLSSAITNSGTVIIDSDVVFVLDNLNGTTDSGSGTTYVIITNTNGGTIKGWDSLDYTNFGLESARQLTSSENGSITIDTSQSAQSLTWAGSSSGSVWDSGNSNNKAWTNSSSADSFYNGDNVTFTSTGAGTITVSGNVHAGTMTVSSGDYTFSSDTTNGGTIKTSSLTFKVARGDTMTIAVSEADLGAVSISRLDSGETDGDNYRVLTIGNGTTTTTATASSLTLLGASEISVADGSTLTVTGNVDFNGGYSENVSGDGTLIVKGTATHATGGTLSISVANFQADTFTKTSSANTIFSGTSATIGTFNMSSGSATVTFTGGGTFTIGSYTESAQNTTFAIGENTTVNVGTFSASWGETFSFSSGSVLNVTEELTLHTNSMETMNLNGGTLNAEKINLSNYEKLTFSNGNLNVGSGGITGASWGSSDYLVFGDGLTVGVYNGESWSTDATIQFTKSGTGTTFSTNSGESIELSGDLSGTGFSNTGSGELILSGTVGLSDAITNSGTIVVNTSSVVFDLTNITGIESGGTYTIITNNSGSITNWDSLDESNFYLKGSTITSVEITTEGQVTISYETITGLIWNGSGDSTTWDTTTANWTSGSSGSDTAFTTGSAVWFDGDGSGTVTVQEGGVTAGSVTVTGGTYSFTGGSIKVTDTFTINKGAEVDLSKSDSIEGNVVVSGTLKFAGSGGGTGEIIGTITINNGGWVELDTGDATGYSSGVTAITINSGGTLYVGTTDNQTLGNCTLTLVGGTIDGVSGSNLDLYGSGSKITVLAESGADASNPTVSTVTNVMLTPRASDNNKGGTTTVEVQANAVLDVQSGFWAGPSTNYSNSLEKTGAGTLEVSGYFAIDGGSLIIDAGTVILSGYAGGTSKNYGFASAVSIAEGANLEICFKEDASISNVSGAGDFTKSGETTLTIAGYSVSGTTTVSEGTLVITGETALGGSAEIHVETGATLDLTGVTQTQTSGDQSSKLDVLYIEGGTVTVQNLGSGWGGQSTNFGSGMYNYTLQISDGGVLDVVAAQGSSGGGERGFAVTSGEGTYRFSGTGTSYIGSNERSIHLGDEATLIFDVVESGATLDVSMVIAKGLASGTSDVVGSETSTGSLVKTGAGTLKLSGTNLYSGGTTIKEGVLVAASAGALGEGTVSIEGGQLSIDSSVTITNSVSVTLSNTYLVSDSVSPTSAGSGTLEPYTAGDGSDGIYAITGTGGTLNTTITLFIDETIAELLADAGEAGLAFYLVDTSGVSEVGSFTVSLSEALSGYTYTYDTDTGILWVAPIPEPSMFGVFAGLGALGLVATRRRRRKAA